MRYQASLDWIAKADEDEQVANLIRVNGGPWSLAAYHLQQAAEKSLKAAVVEAGMAVPKTHDLVQLVGLLPNTVIPPEVDSAVAMLSAFAWITRYPGGPSIDRTHVEECFIHLEAIKGWIRP